ncbi:restriction endonuclease subunit S [Methanobrevibacter smithii]|uniref:restriction endonuclease subunit S n=1 Tax=Methanobrevibacter smithii TaxID=2173 RepID=UPI00307D3D79
MIESKIDIANITFTHPSDWNVIKIKYLLSTKVTDGPHETPTFIDEGYPFLSVDSIVDGKLVFEGCRYISKEDYDKYKLKCNPQKDDIFMGKAASIGKIAIVDVDFNFSIWSPLALLRPNKDVILPNFLEFALKSDYAQDQIDLYSTSNTQKNISMDDIPRIELLVPNLEQQKAITNYLIKKTSKIDATIAKNEELIQLLEEKRVALINQVVTKGLNSNVSMKDSGIKGIGEIPKHWDVEKIKNISQVKPSNVDKKTKANEPHILLCNYTDVYNNEFITRDLDFMKATATHDQIRKLSLKVGDVIITKDSESADDIAVPAIVTENLENVVCGYHLAVIRPNSTIINPKFLFRSFESDRINKQFELGANGVTRFGLGSYPINNAYICYPPLNEQAEIVQYLDIETSRIAKATDKILKHIELLGEYKSSLIHHVVTGKIDVRGEVI